MSDTTWTVSRRSSRVDGNQILERQADAGPFILRVKRYSSIWTWDVTRKVGSGNRNLGFWDNGFAGTLAAGKAAAEAAVKDITIAPTELAASILNDVHSLTSELSRLSGQLTRNAADLARQLANGQRVDPEWIANCLAKITTVAVKRQALMDVVACVPDPSEVLVLLEQSLNVDVRRLFGAAE